MLQFVTLSHVAVRYLWGLFIKVWHDLACVHNYGFGLHCVMYPIYGDLTVTFLFNKPSQLYFLWKLQKATYLFLYRTKLQHTRK